MASSPLTILVSGMLAGVPGHGGATWAVLQYILGLRRLGHDVFFVEPVDASQDLPEVASYFTAVVGAFGMAGRSALFVDRGRWCLGMPIDGVEAAARRSDILINLGGTLTEPRLVERIPVRVYVDLDPGFTQLWAAQGVDVGLAGHTRFVTVGPAIGTPECAIPTGGLRWIGTLPPVVLERWPRADRVEMDAFTTVGNWRSYGSIEHGGRHYGQKAHSLRRFAELPSMTGQRFVLAMGIHPDERADLDLLAGNGWEVVDPVVVSRTPDRFRRFVRGSRAELGVTKSGYVAAACGWLGDRSACYLASGRPVVAQDTGFGRFLPTGRGLFAFETAEEAALAVDEVRTNYRDHARAARVIAEEHLDSDAVLTGLVHRVLGNDG